MSQEKKHFENAVLNLEDEKNGKIDHEALKQGNTLRQDSVPLLFAAINSRNLDDVSTHLQQTTEHINSCKYGGLTPLHAACHMQHLGILKLLIAHGAKIDILDSLGNSPLHVAAREKWCVGIKELLEQGASPNQMSEPPTDLAGQLKETPLHAAVRTGEATSVTLMLKQKPELSIRDRNNYTVFHLAAITRNDHILKQLLINPDSRKILEDLKEDTDSLYHAALPPNTTIANEDQVLKVIQIVYKCNDNINVVNFHGETPIFLACLRGLPNVAKYLLDRGADPTKVTREGQNALHAACRAGCSTTLRYLLQIPKVKELITSQDSDQRTPFYFAVDSASIECCKILLVNGEHLTHIGYENVSNCTLVMQKLPSAMRLFRELFDSGVKLSKNHRYDPDFSITFDYSVLMSSENDEMQSSIASELAGTPLESLIKHPLLESFLFIKWSRIKNVFYWSVIQYFLYVLLHTVFVVLAYGKNEGNYLNWYDALKIAHIVLLVIICIPAFIIGIANFRNIIYQWESYTRLTAIVTSVIVVFITTDILIKQKEACKSIMSDVENRNCFKSLSPKTLLEENGLASVSVLSVWVELMMLLGRFPALGSYILMFTKVSKSLIKFILAFLSLIIGFAMCFYVLFKKMPVFRNFGLSFSKTIMMMTGEIAYSEFITQNDMNCGIFCLLTIDVFVFLVTIVTSNLLIGLAVNDIPQLRRLGKIKRLVKQASYLMAYETVLAVVYKMKFLPSGIKECLSSRSSIKSVIKIHPNKEKMRGKYFSLIPPETIQEAIDFGNSENLEDFQPTSEDDIGKQLKAFQKRYSNDRRTQKHKFEDLGIISSDIMKGLNNLQSKVNKGMSKFSSDVAQLSDQVQDQLNENQNLLEKLLKRIQKVKL